MSLKVNILSLHYRIRHKGKWFLVYLLANACNWALLWVNHLYAYIPESSANIHELSKKHYDIYLYPDIFAYQSIKFAHRLLCD